MGPGAAFGTVATKFMMEDAQKHQIQILKNQKQWLYDDLRAAGINPILAMGTGQVAGGTSSPTVSGGGTDIGREIRSGQLQKAAREKVMAEAGTAKWTEKIGADLKSSSSANVVRDRAHAEIAGNESIIKMHERDQAVARSENILQGIRSRKQLDAAGIPALGLSGANLRQFNAIIRQLGGRDQSGARE